MFEFAVAAFWCLCGVLCVVVIFAVIVGVIKWVKGESKKEK